MPFTKGHIPWNKNKPWPEEMRRRISVSQKGKTINENQRRGLSTRWGTEENSPLWKGDNIGYRGIHSWVEKKLGKPKKCENCGLEGENLRFDWANKSGKYKREITDWMRLCVFCHRLYDYGRIDDFILKTYQQKLP